MDYVTKDSGEREYFDTGMKRDVRFGKGRFDLITPLGLRRLAQVYERGAEKYDDRNWEKGSAFGRFLDSAERHINDYKAGLRDEDHLAQAAWNLFSIMHLETTHPELQDLKTYLDSWDIPEPKSIDTLLSEECAQNSDKVLVSPIEEQGCYKPTEENPVEASLFQQLSSKLFGRK